MSEETRKRKKLFFALWPDHAIRHQLIEASKAYRAGGVTMPARNLHITLVFIGYVDATQQQCLKVAASQVQGMPFTLTLDTIDHFGQRILWMGCKQVPEGLFTLHNLLTESLVEHCEFNPEKHRYRPHVTLQRKIRKPLQTDLEHSIEWPVRRFSLVESIPPVKRFAQPCYRPLQHWELGSHFG